MRVLSDGGAQKDERLKTIDLRCTVVFGADFALILLAVQQSGQSQLVFVLAGIGALVLMLGASFGLIRLLKRSARGVGVSWRFGLGRLYRHPVATTFQIASMGLGLTVLVTLSLVRGQLFESWESRVPAGSPNFFLANVQDYEQPEVTDFFQENLNKSLEFIPMATGRLVTINGKVPNSEAYPDPRSASRIEGNLNFSWAREMPRGNTLIAGDWRPDQNPVVSLAESWAAVERTVGDRIGVRVGSEIIDAKSNLRRVQWKVSTQIFSFYFHPTFLMTPHSFLSSVRLEEEQQDVLVDLSRQFPR